MLFANNSLIVNPQFINPAFERYILLKNSINRFFFFISCIYHKSSCKHQQRSMNYFLVMRRFFVNSIALSFYRPIPNRQFIYKQQLFLFGFDTITNYIIVFVILMLDDKNKIRYSFFKKYLFIINDYFEQNQIIKPDNKEVALKANYQKRLKTSPLRFPTENLLQSIFNQCFRKYFHRRLISTDNTLQIFTNVQQKQTEHFEAMKIDRIKTIS